MAQRRLADRVASQVFVPADPGLPEAGGIADALARATRGLHSFHLPVGRTDFVARPFGAVPDTLEAIFVIGVSREDVLLISGDEQLLLSTGGEGEVSTSRFAAAVAAVRRARARSLRRCASRDAFLLLSERLSRAQCRREVLDALLDGTPRVVEAYAAVLAVQSSDAAYPSPLEWHSALVGSDGGPTLLPPLPASFATRFSVSGVLTPESCTEDESLVLIARLFELTKSTKLAFVGLNGLGTIFIAERRPEREFDADDWHLLGVVARQAEDALTRLDRTYN